MVLRQPRIITTTTTAYKYSCRANLCKRFKRNNDDDDVEKKKDFYNYKINFTLVAKFEE